MPQCFKDDDLASAASEWCRTSSGRTIAKADGLHGPVNTWQVESIKSMKGLFESCPRLMDKEKLVSQIFQVDKWDTDEATSMRAMFAGAGGFIGQDRPE